MEAKHQQSYQEEYMRRGLILMPEFTVSGNETLHPNMVILAGEMLISGILTQIKMTDFN